MSEVTIEQWFGFLRCQSTSATLTARQFWQAGARQMLKHGKLLNRSKPAPLASEQHLTDEKRLGCAQS